MQDLGFVGVDGRRGSGWASPSKNFHSDTVAVGIGRHILWLASLLVLLTAPWARAQVLYGSLTGGVTDASGAVVVGAKVTALEVQTGVTQETTTDSVGIYRLTTLQPGTYKVTISASGFATQ